MMSTTHRTDAVWFTTKGQVVIPSWLRKQFDIEDGTKCIVQATTDGILELFDDRLIMKVIAASLLEVLLELHDLGNVGHDGELRAELVEQPQHAVGGFDHEFVRTTFTVAVNLVVEGEQNFQHRSNGNH